MRQSPNKRTKRYQVILERWCWIGAYGLVAAVVWFLLDPFLASISASLIHRLADVPTYLLLSLFAVLFAVPAYLSARGRWLGWSGLHHIHTYPPLWVAVLAGIAFSWLFNIAAPTSQSLSLLSSWCSQALSLLSSWSSQVLSFGGLAAVLLIVHSVVIRLRDMRKAKSRTPIAPPAASGSFVDRLANIDDIAKWLATDDAVENRDHDGFNHDEVARRIVQRLTSAGDDDAPTMAVVGPLGSGKTTIGNLVRRRLEPHARLRMIQLSLWPYESSAAAQMGVLGRLVDEIARHVNVLGVRGLPEHYISTVEKAAGPWGGFATLFRTARDPGGILDRLSKILVATDLRIVLWIEDLERFAGTSPQAGEEPLPRDTERVAPVRTLLYLLDRCDRISVIAADATLTQRIDIGKIARYVERPPRMDIQSVWRIIGALRAACLNGHPRGFINPANPKLRDASEPLDETSLAMSRALRFDRDPKPQEALVDLLDTPRSLKNVLRLTYSTWECLVGEIDFDDVLFASVIRVAHPVEFAFIDEHIDVFRGDFSQALSSKDDPAKHPIAEAFDRLLEKNDHRKAIESLTRVVFPDLPTPRHHANVDKAYIDKPQGLSVDRHVDYWSRYLSVPEVSEESSDQAALRSIKSWRCGDDNDLVSRLLDEASKADQVETFAGMLEPTDLCRLLEEVALRSSAESANGWEHRLDAPGVVPVWRMMLRRRPPRARLTETLVSLINEVTPIHLPLAYCVFYYVATGDLPGEPLIGEDQREQVRTRFRDVLGASFSTGRERVLLEALKQGTPWVLWHILRGSCGDGWIDRGTPPPTVCVQLCQVMLDAAEVDRSAALLQILPFVTKTARRHGDAMVRGEERRVLTYTGEFLESPARALFNNIDRLASLFANAEKPDDLSDEMGASWDAAVEFARQYKPTP